MKYLLSISLCFLSGSNMFLSEQFDPKKGCGGHFCPFSCLCNVSNVCLLAQYCACSKKVEMLTGGVLLVSGLPRGKNVKFTWRGEGDIFLDGFRATTFLLEQR